MAKSTPKPAVRRTSPQARGYQVFVSHATADKWIAKTICDKLKSRGVKTFRDERDIQGGEDIPENLVQQIIRSREFVVVLTPHSAGRPWVMLEVGAAWGRRRRITVIMCHVDVDAIPAIIRSKKAYPLNDLDRYLGEVATRARNHKS